MNPLIISCDKCGYFFSSNNQFNYRYKINDEEFVVETSFAWCSSCKKIVFAERLPTIGDVSSCYKDLLKVRNSIKNQTEINKKQHPFLYLVNKKIYDNENKLLNFELDEESIVFVIDKLLKLAAELNLNRNPRCLNCFSQRIQYLNIDFSKLNIPFMGENLAIKIGVPHYGCGGDFEVAYSPVRLYRKKRDIKYLSADGLIL